MRQGQVFLDVEPGMEQTTNLESKVATEDTEDTEEAAIPDPWLPPDS
jgi:hypothetical protein